MNTVQLIAEWFAWVESLTSGGLGYPTHSPITNEGGKTVPGPKAPRIECPRHLEPVDAAMRKIPKGLKEVLRLRHEGRGTDKAIARSAGIPYSTYRHRLAMAYAWIDGAVS